MSKEEERTPIAPVTTPATGPTGAPPLPGSIPLNASSRYTIVLETGLLAQAKTKGTPDLTLDGDGNLVLHISLGAGKHTVEERKTTSSGGIVTAIEVRLKV